MTQKFITVLQFVLSLHLRLSERVVVVIIMVKSIGCFPPT